MSHPAFGGTNRDHNLANSPDSYREPKKIKNIHMKHVIKGAILAITLLSLYIAIAWMKQAI